jgi:hypothetical protein
VRDAHLRRELNYTFALRYAQLGVQTPDEINNNRGNDAKDTADIVLGRILHAVDGGAYSLDNVRYQVNALGTDDQTLVHLVLGLQQGAEGEAWKLFKKSAEKAHRMSIDRRVQMIDRLIGSNHLEEATHLARTLPLYDDIYGQPGSLTPDGDIMDYRTNAFRGIAQQQAANGDYTAAHGTLHSAEKDQLAMHALMERKKDSNGTDNDYLMECVRNTLTELRLDHLAIDAQQDPTSALITLQAYLAHELPEPGQQQLDTLRYVISNVVRPLVAAGYTAETAAIANQLPLKYRSAGYSAIGRHVQNAAAELQKRRTQASSGLVALAGVEAAIVPNESVA